MGVVTFSNFANELKYVGSIRLVRHAITTTKLTKQRKLKLRSRCLFEVLREEVQQT